MTSRVGDYLLRETLGTGAFGKVRRAVHQSTGRHYAIKIMEKALIRNQELTLNVRREIAIMKAFNHPNIVSVHNVLTSKTRLYVVLDLVQGPELFEVIAKRGAGGLPEKEARRFFQNLVDGVDYCHRRGVCHRDLKPENLLVDHDGRLKITDFGLSSMKGANTTTDLLTTQCGTPNYIAPEIISCANPIYDGQKVDAWACGIILYALLAGYLPFDETDLAYLFEVIQKGHVEFPHWFSAGARDLIWRLLVVDPDTRASVQVIKQHPWFLVNYEPCPRNGITSAGARRRRRRSRASRSLDETGIERLSTQPSGHQMQDRHLPTSGNCDTTRLPTLSVALPTLQLPTLQLPILQPSVVPNEGELNTSLTAAAAAETARMEMLRSRRTMSFSKKYSLLRKGTVNYGGLEIGVRSFRGPTTLGGEHQARLRGVLSTCDSSLFSSQRDIEVAMTATEPDAKKIEESQGPRNLNEDDTSEQRDTMQAIQSLRDVISSSRTMLRNVAEVKSNRGGEEDQIRESTLKAVRKLRDELRTADCSFKKYREEHFPGHSSQCASIMSPSQRKDTIRLLDVWESRILNDLRSEKGSENTRVTEAEIVAFQSLLQTWETHLDGEDFVEDVLIPGSEAVDDESPATMVPERFLDTCNFLRHIECRRKDCEGDHIGKRDKRCTILASPRIPSYKEQPRPSLSAANMQTSTGNVWSNPSSSQEHGDLTRLWNHVLVANTSKLDAPPENICTPHKGASIVAQELIEEPTPSPVTDCQSSSYSTEGSEQTIGGTKKGRDRSRTWRGSSGAVTPKSTEAKRLPPSSPTPAKTDRQFRSVHPQRTVEDKSSDLQLLKSIKSHEFVTETPLVRSHAQRQIRVDSESSQNEMEQLSSESLHGVRQAENESRSGSLQTKIEPLKSNGLHGGHIDSLLAATRKYNFLHIRSKYSAQFESGYDPRMCLRELGRLMEKEGIDVSRKHGHKTLRVRIPGPRKYQGLTASFDFHARGQMGSVVHFKRISGDRSVPRSEEETILSTFLRKVLNQFSDADPGFAVLRDGR